MGIFYRFLPVLRSNAGQGFQSLLHLQECQAEKEGTNHARYHFFFVVSLVRHFKINNLVYRPFWKMCKPLIFFIQPIKDWVLMLVVAVLVAIDVVFLVIVTVDMWRLTLNIRLLDREVYN